ncbi:hypothetical protein O9929_12390 [Vibrio lentus]|nr:hypothetical protein [Vibrio lentus]
MAATTLIFAISHLVFLAGLMIGTLPRSSLERPSAGALTQKGEQVLL